MTDGMYLSFQALRREAWEIRSLSKFRNAIQNIIMSAEVNASDTLGPREELPYEHRGEWDDIALDSVRGLLTGGDPIDAKVFNWFARRILV